MKANNAKTISLDKLPLVNFQPNKFVSIEEEKNYLEKADSHYQNLKKYFKWSQKRRGGELFKMEEQMNFNLKRCDDLVSENSDLRKKFVQLEEQLEMLNIESKKIEEKKQKYYTDIIKLRKESTKELDQKVNLLNKQDKQVKALKKELYLLMNLLKIRVVNIDSIAEENVIKGYLVNTEKNSIKYLEINKQEKKDINSCLAYWTEMNDLHAEEKIDKENVNILNINK
jgi:hypothetical protein